MPKVNNIILLQKYLKGSCSNKWYESYVLSLMMLVGYSYVEQRCNRVSKAGHGVIYDWTLLDRRFSPRKKVSIDLGG